jgi:hypothetical protein
MKSSTITSLEMRAVEQILGMSGGYVLDFSNRTFEIFFAELEVEIEPEDYGLSKAKRLRAFLRTGSPSEVARVLNALLKYRGERSGDESSPALSRYRATVARLEGVKVSVSAPVTSPDVLTLQYVHQLAQKADHRLESGDLEGAITLSRTLLEAVLSELELRLTGTSGVHGGDLLRQYKMAVKNLRINDQDDQVDDGFKQLARGLVQIVGGLATIRNRASDGHARTVAPREHHARVAVNSAKTVVSFLVEAYLASSVHALAPDVREVMT